MSESLGGCLWNALLFLYPSYGTAERLRTEHTLQCRAEAHDTQATALETRALSLAREALSERGTPRSYRLGREARLCQERGKKMRAVADACRRALDVMRESAGVRETVDALEGARAYLQQSDARKVFAKLDGVTGDMQEACELLTETNDMLREVSEPTTVSDAELMTDLQAMFEIDLLPSVPVETTRFAETPPRTVARRRETPLGDAVDSA